MSDQSTAENQGEDRPVAEDVEEAYRRYRLTLDTYKQLPFFEQARKKYKERGIHKDDPLYAIIEALSLNEERFVGLMKPWVDINMEMAFMLNEALLHADEQDKTNLELVKKNEELMAQMTDVAQQNRNVLAACGELLERLPKLGETLLAQADLITKTTLKAKLFDSIVFFTGIGFGASLAMAIYFLLKH